MEIYNNGDCLITSGIFGNGKTLNGLLSSSVNVVLGMNGSGKSTIARCFDEKRKKENDNSIFVFNEEYINDNVRIKSEGIGSIAMFGKQVSDEAEKSKKQEELANTQTLLQQTEKDINSLNEMREVVRTKIVDRLDMKDDSYSRRLSTSRLYKNNSTKSSNGAFDANQVIKSMMALTEEERNSTTIQDATDLAEEVGKAKSDFATWHQLLNIDMIDSIIGKAESLLGRSVRKPELTEEDKHLLHIASTASLSHYLNDTQRLINENMHICPVCHQPLSQTYLDDLKSKIEKVLNREAEEYKSEITSCMTDVRLLIEGSRQNDTCLEQLAKVKGFTYNNMERVALALERMRNELTSLQTQLEEKSKNLFSTSTLQGKIKEIARDFRHEQDDLKQAVDTHNNLRNEANQKMERFNKVNLIAAYHESKDDVEKYRDLLKRSHNLGQQRQEYEKEIGRLKTSISKLSQGKQDYLIAVDQINNYLYTIFCEQKLTLEYNGRYYAVKVYGRDIQPNKLSTGERNALALAYFFASINSNKSKEEEFSSDILVVVDDPITSFDQNNVMGMWTLMVMVFKRIVANTRSKVLLMTHDVSTAGYFGKIFELRDQNGKEKIKFLENLGIWQKNLFEDDYWNLMHDISKYGFGDDATVDNGIINKMRRLLDSFCSFNYKKQADFENITCNNSYMHENDRLYFQSCNNRFFLNSGSHEIAKETTLTIPQKKAMARAVIYYLYLQDERHIAAYSKNEYILIQEKIKRHVPIIQ